MGPEDAGVAVETGKQAAEGGTMLSCRHLYLVLHLLATAVLLCHHSLQQATSGLPVDQGGIRIVRVTNLQSPCSFQPRGSLMPEYLRTFQDKK